MCRISIFLFIFCTASNAIGATLHMGDKLFRLSTHKNTSPALATIIGDQYFYGALYSGPATSDTAHIQYGNEYWLGQNCEPGTYSENGTTECINCGIGHYCTGGIHRATCTYGAISCNNTIHSMDPSENAPLNRFLTLDEVNKFFPVTDFSDWRLLSNCGEHLGATSDDLTSPNILSKACASGTIGPGAYLFVTRYRGGGVSSFTDCVSDTYGGITSAFIAVFNHPVGYASIHGVSIFQHFVDTEHAQYETYTISSSRGWNTNRNETNISNLINLPEESRLLAVYELK